MNRRYLLVLLASAAACAAPDTLPKAEAILDRYVEVTGGKAAWEKRKSEVSSGAMEFTGRGIKGTVSSYSAEPDLSYQVIEIEGLGKIESGTGGGVAWEKSAFMGPRVRDGAEKEDSLRDSHFNAPLHWRKLYSKAETTGEESVGGEECYKIQLTPGAEKPDALWFSKKTGLLVKRTRTVVSPMGEIPAEFLMSDYKDFAGVLQPAKVVQKAAGQEFTITMEKATANEKLSKDRFEPPADIKALLEKAAK